MVFFSLHLTPLSFNLAHFPSMCPSWPLESGRQTWRSLSRPVPEHWAQSDWLFDAGALAAGPPHLCQGARCGGGIVERLAQPRCSDFSGPLASGAESCGRLSSTVPHTLPLTWRPCSLPRKPMSPFPSATGGKVAGWWVEVNEAEADHEVDRGVNRQPPTHACSQPHSHTSTTNEPQHRRHRRRHTP